MNYTNGTNPSEPEPGTGAGKLLAFLPVIVVGITFAFKTRILNLMGYRIPQASDVEAGTLETPVNLQPIVATKPADDAVLPVHSSALETPGVHKDDDIQAIGAGLSGPLTATERPVQAARPKTGGLRHGNGPQQVGTKNNSSPRLPAR